MTSPLTNIWLRARAQAQAGQETCVREQVVPLQPMTASEGGVSGLTHTRGDSCLSQLLDDAKRCSVSKRPPSEEQRVPLWFHALSDGPKGRSAGDSRHMPLDTGLLLVCIYASHSKDPSDSSKRWVSWTFGSSRALCRADTEGSPAFLSMAALLGIHTRAGRRQKGLDVARKWREAAWSS